MLHIFKGEMTGTYPKKSYILVASTIQMAVLLQFNYKDSFTIKELAKFIGTDCTLMQQVVSTLIKHNLLVRRESSMQYLENSEETEPDLPDQNESGALYFTNDFIFL